MALDSLVRAGKVRYLGASSMAAWQFSKALYVAREHDWHRFVAMQNHYNLIYREEEREMIPLCLDQGVGLIPWSPLARGFFAGNRQEGRRGVDHQAGADRRLCAADVFPGQRFQGRSRGAGSGPPTRRHAHPDRLRLDSAGIGRHRAHHRRHQAPSSQGKLCRG